MANNKSAPVQVNPGMDSRTREHINSQGKGLARESSRPKTSSRPVPIHPGMQSQTRGAIGGPTQGNPPDASSPLPTDPTREGKSFPTPALAMGMKSDPERGFYNPAHAHAVMGEASRHSDDFARDLHTVLPQATEED